MICLVEDSSCLQIEIALLEEEAAQVRPGQIVDLKARSLPFEIFRAQVERVASAAGRVEPDRSAVPADPQSAVVVYCRLENAHVDLKPGMTGYARVYRGPRPVGRILGERILRIFRTEFWW